MANDLNFVLKVQDQGSASLNTFLTSMQSMGHMTGVTVDQLKAYQQQMAGVGISTEALQALTHKASDAIQLVNGHFQLLSKTAREAADAVSAHGDAHAQATTSVLQHGEAQERAAAQVQKHGEAVKGTEAPLRTLVSNAKEAAEAIGAIWASGELNEKTIGAWAETEVALLRFNQTAKLTGEGLEHMEEKAQKVSFSALNANVEQVISLFKQASEAGIKSQEGMETFAQTVVNISNVTGQATESIARGMTTILSATQETQDGVEKFGNAFATLAANTRGGGEALMATADMMLHHTSGLKLSSVQLLALASATESLGLRQYTSGMAVSQVMTMMATTAEKGGVALGALAQQLGMNTDQMRAMVKEHPDQALVKFLEAANGVLATGKPLNTFMKQFGQDNMEVVTAVTAAAKHVDEFKNKLTEASNADPSALAKANDPMTKTIMANLGEIKTRVATLFEGLGKAFEPVLNPILTVTIKLLDQLRLAWEGLGKISTVGPVLQSFFAALIIGIPMILAVSTAWRFLTEVILAGGGAFRQLSGYLGLGAKAMNTLAAAEEEVGMTTLAMTAKTDAAAASMRSIGAASVTAGAEATAAATKVSTASAIMAGASARSLSAITAVQGRLNQAWALAGNVAKSGMLKWNAGISAVTGGLAEYAESGSTGRALSTGAGAGAGAALGTWVGAGIGSLVGPVGTVAGGVVGSMVGGYLGGEGGRKAYDATTGYKPGEGHGGEHGEGHADGHGDEHKPSPYGELDTSSFASPDAIANGRVYLEQLDTVTKKMEELKKQQETLNLLRTQPESARAGAGFSDDKLQSMQQIHDANARKADYVKNEQYTMGQQADAAAAITGALKEQLALHQDILKAQDAGVVLTGQAGEKNKALLEQARLRLQATERQAAFEGEAHGLAQKLAMARAVTQEDKAQLAIEQQLEELKRNKNLDGGQLDALRKQLELTKQITDQLAVQDKINPWAKAGRDYKTESKTLDDTKMSEAERTRQKYILDRQTKESRDPGGKIVQDYRDQLDMVKEINANEKMTVEAQQQILALQAKLGPLSREYKDAIIDAAKAMEDVKKAQDSGLEGWMKKVGDIKDGMRKIEEDFANGLSDAIVGALSGKRGNFMALLKSMSGSMLKVGVDQIMKEGMKSLGMQNLFGLGSKGAADAAKGPLDKLAGISDKSMEQMTVTAGTVILNASNLSGAGAGGVGGVGASGLNPDGTPNAAAAATAGSNLATAPGQSGSFPGVAALLAGPAAALKLGEHSPVSIGPGAAPVFSMLPQAPINFGAHATGPISTASPSAFSSSIYQQALAMGKGEPQARLAAAQASLESAGGRHMPAGSNNLFGIKAGKGWNGPSVGAHTHEDDGTGALHGEAGSFRAYASPQASLEDYFKKLERQWPGAAHAKTWEEAKAGLRTGKQGGYATDTHYSEKLDAVDRHTNKTQKPVSGELSAAEQAKLKGVTNSYHEPDKLTSNGMSEKDLLTQMTKPPSAGAAVNPISTSFGKDYAEKAASFQGISTKDFHDQWAAGAYARAQSAGMDPFHARMATNQASMESAFGASPGSQLGRNYFNMKAGKGSSWTGPTFSRKTEEENGGHHVENADWRQYTDEGQTFKDHNAVLQRKWPDAAKADNIEDFNHGLRHGQQGGYSTLSEKAYLDRLKGADGQTQRAIERFGTQKPIIDSTHLPKLPPHAELDTAQKKLSESLKATEQSFTKTGQGVTSTLPKFAQLDQGITKMQMPIQTAVPSISGMGESVTKLTQTAQAGPGVMDGLSQSITKMLSSAGGGMGGIFGMVAHSGALVGSTFGDGFRSVPAGTFTHAPRFHSGLKNDEYPAILQKGERVLTAHDDARTKSTINGLTEAMAKRAGGAGGNTTNNKSAHVTLNFQGGQPADSFRKSAGQMMSQAGVLAQRMANRNA